MGFNSVFKGLIFSSQYEEKSVHSQHNKATENVASFDKAGTNK